MTEAETSGTLSVSELMTMATIAPSVGAAVERPETRVFEDAGSGNAKPVDPLNAAIAATAGEPVEKGAPEMPPDPVSPWQAASDEARMTAQEGHVKAGVEKAMAAVGNAEIVTVAAFKAGVEALLGHLHFDHPENYLPKG